MFEIDPPFGTYALPPAREAWRKKARGYVDTKMGRVLLSRARKKALAGEAGPFDVEVDQGVYARLYPMENRCEKRAFAGVQTWDAEERAALQSAIMTGAQDIFTFIDVGANVGLYSLYAQAYARSAGRPIRIIAIEPGLETCARLEANIAASEATVQIIRAAVSDAPRAGYLKSDRKNRGEAKLSERDDSTVQEPVIIDTLSRILRTQGVSDIDAMKVDIEGHDLRAMTAFFEDAPESLHPRLLILEIGKTLNSPLLELCHKNGYITEHRSGLNAILGKRPHV